MEFERKQLEPTKRVGIRLKEAREKQGLGLETLSKRMKVSKKYIASIEKSEFNKIPFAPIYKKNLIRNYAKTLGFEPKSYMLQYESEEHKEEEFAPIPAIRSSSRVTLNVPAITKFILSFALIASVIFYIGFQVKNIIAPPELFLQSPREGQITHESEIIVRGNTEKETRVFINGNEIRTNEEGSFEEQIDLQVGVNTITFTAQKKHGQTTKETRHVTYRQSSDHSSPGEISDTEITIIEGSVTSTE